MNVAVNGRLMTNRRLRFERVRTEGKLLASLLRGWKTVDNSKDCHHATLRLSSPNRSSLRVGRFRRTHKGPYRIRIAATAAREPLTFENRALCVVACRAVNA